MKWADTFQPHHVQTLREHTGATKQPFHRHQCTEFFILRCTILSTNSFLSFPLVKSLFTDWQNDLWKHVSKLWIFILNYFRFELVSFHLFLLERHKWLFSNMLRHIGSLSSLAEEITVFFFSWKHHFSCLFEQCMSTSRIHFEVSTSEIMSSRKFASCWYERNVWKVVLIFCDDNLFPIAYFFHILNSINFKN